MDKYIIGALFTVLALVVLSLVYSKVCTPPSTRPSTSPPPRPSASPSAAGVEPWIPVLVGLLVVGAVILVILIWRRTTKQGEEIKRREEIKRTKAEKEKIISDIPKLTASGNPKQIDAALKKLNTALEKVGGKPEDIPGLEELTQVRKNLKPFSEDSQFKLRTEINKELDIPRFKKSVYGGAMHDLKWQIYENKVRKNEKKVKEQLEEINKKYITEKWLDALEARFNNADALVEKLEIEEEEARANNAKRLDADPVITDLASSLQSLKIS